MNVELEKAVDFAKSVNKASLLEDTTREEIVLRILRALGWNSGNTDEVRREYPAGNTGKRVDIALLVKGEPVVFIEAKASRKGHLTDKNKKQILQYCWDASVQFGVITNGIIWCLYSSADVAGTKINDYAIEVDLAEGQLENVVNVLERFLHKVGMARNYTGVVEELESEKVGRILNETWARMLQQEHLSLVRALRREVKNKLPKVPLARVRSFIRQCSNAPEDKKPDAVSKRTRRIARPKAQAEHSNKEMHPTRKALLVFLRREPQATYVQIAEALNMSTGGGGVSNALKRAIEEKHIHKMKQGRTCTYQVLVDPDGGAKPVTNAARSQSRTKKRSTPAISVVKRQGDQREIKNMSETMKSLLTLLMREPSATQARVAEVLGMTKSGAYSALKRAGMAGYIRKSKRGRTCTYTVLVSLDAEVTQVRIL